MYPKNTMIFCEGEPGDEVFFIKQGMVKISKVVDNREILLAILNKGEVFGEMAILESIPRGASAIAYEDAQVMVVNNSNFELLIKTQPALISHITSILAKRIWLVYKKITNTQIEDPMGRMLDMLFIQLEKKRVNVNVRELYIFDFGPKELINLIGLTPVEGNIAIQKLLKTKYISLVQERIAIKDMFEFFKQANFYRSKR
jgi:CRP-like cAMP-binding protein